MCRTRGLGMTRWCANACVAFSGGFIGEFGEDVSHRRRKGLDVRVHILGIVVLIAHQLLDVQRRRVVEQQACLL